MEVSESQSPDLDIPKALTIILEAKLEIKGHIVLDKKKKKKENISFHLFSLKKSWEVSRIM